MQPRSLHGLDGHDVARWCAAGIGVLLIAIGLVGFIDNPLVADPAADPLIVTGTVHNMLHLTLGALALYIAVALSGRMQADGLIAYGVFVLVIVVLTLLSPNLFGILGSSPGYDVGLLAQLLHLAVGVVSIVVGVLARRGPSRSTTPA